MAKLIMTVAEMQDRNAWLDKRGLGLGGSDAGVVVGVSRWKQPYQLWLEKTGQAEQPDLSDNESVYWGSVLEEAVANRFTEVTGKKVHKAGLYQSEEYPFMLASPDRLVVGEKAGLEIKTANGWAAKEWADDKVPDTYYCQVQHYLAVMEMERWYICVLLGGQKFLWKTIERNEKDIQALIEAEKNFWNFVTTKTAPPVDASALDYLAERFPQAEHSEPIALEDKATEIIDEMFAIERRTDDLDERYNSLKAELCQMLGTNEAGISGQYKVTWVNHKGRESFDTKKFKAEHPELVAQYTKVGRPYRMFGIRGGY